MYLVVLNGEHETWTKEVKTKKEVGELIEENKRHFIPEIYKVTKKLTIEDFTTK